MITKKDIVQQLLREKNGKPGSFASAFAPVNIALCKYWGKRDEELNLPNTNSFECNIYYKHFRFT